LFQYERLKSGVTFLLLLPEAGNGKVAPVPRQYHRGMTQRAMEAEAVRSGMEIGTTRLA